MTHVQGKHHLAMLKATSSSSTLTHLVREDKGAIEAEACWAIFTAKHNLPFILVIMPPSFLLRCFPTLYC